MLAFRPQLPQWKTFKRQAPLVLAYLLLIVTYLLFVVNIEADNLLVQHQPGAFLRQSVS